MDSYIVRVYRRDKLGNSPIRGLVEKVGAVGQEAFGTKEELWGILSHKNRPVRQGKRSKSLRQEKKKQEVPGEIETGNVTGGDDNEIV